MKELLRFHNKQAAAIHTNDPKALVTVGAWCEYTITDENLENGKHFFNYYKDECLEAAGGEKNGYLDFYQVHTYNTHSGAPFERKSGDYKLDKPLVIGESGSKASSKQNDVGKELQYALNNDYAGAWDWCLLGGDGNDNAKSATKGLKDLKGNSKVVVDVNQNMPLPEDTCSAKCSDIPPDSSYSCA
jgi:hypothetical protein